MFSLGRDVPAFLAHVSGRLVTEIVGCFDYMTGVVFGGGSATPHGLLRLDLPAQRSAAFHHDGHIAEIRSVIAAIWSDGLAKSGYEPVPGPTLEKYGPKFDKRTGLGGYEIWIAVR